MSDEIEVFKESAKAAQEIAKATGKAIDAASDLGKFVAKMLGTFPEDVVGLAFGDYVRAKRYENAERVFRRAEERLASRGVEEPDPIDLKYTRPLLEAVSEESDETLQDMWADLIANAMDPNRTVKLQRVFIEALKALEPFDAKVLKTFHAYATPAKPGEQLRVKQVYQNLPNGFCDNFDTFLVSKEHLMRLGLISENGGELRTTALSRELTRAVEPNDG